MRVTIHQPDFLPWFGLFNKIAKCDVWIVLDHVENNPRDAAFWGRRVKILVNGRPTWLSIPLNRPATGAIGMPIREMTVNRSDPRLFEKALRTVQQAYARAPYYRDHAALVEAWFGDPEPSLLMRNMRFIEAVLERLEVRPRVVYSSSLNPTTQSTALLVELLTRVGATTYVCGTGAAGYQQDAMFEARGISVEYNRFIHPVYPQLHATEFVPGLSIIDALSCVPRSRLAEHVRTA